MTDLFKWTDGWMVRVLFRKPTQELAFDPFFGRSSEINDTMYRIISDAMGNAKLTFPRRHAATN